MVRKIIKKDMLANLTSLRFVLTLLLVSAVFFVNGFVFVNRYKQELEYFNAESSKNLSGLSLASKNLSNVSEYVQIIHKQPKITNLFYEGFEKSLPNTFKINAFSVQNPEITGNINFFFPRFADIDWVFIISLILSFVALRVCFEVLIGKKQKW